jgi:hypothetical protein
MGGFMGQGASHSAGRRLPFSRAFHDVGGNGPQVFAVWALGIALLDPADTRAIAAGDRRSYRGANDCRSDPICHQLTSRPGNWVHHRPRESPS